MGVHNVYQDFADRHYKYFGGQKHFGFLVRVAKKFGISYCDQVIADMKQFGRVIKKSGRIKYFTTVIYRDTAKKKLQNKKTPF